MPEHTDPTPEQSLSRREALKLAGAIAAFGAALGVRPASSVAQGKEEGKTEGKTEGKAKAKTEGKADTKAEGKTECKATGK
jgi:flagellar biosynthesis/type III secretory pathway protein FliH